MAKSVSERLKDYREKTQTERLEIIGLPPETKQAFKNILGLEKVTNAGKLKALIDYWIDGHSKKLPVNEKNDIPDKKSYPVNINKIEDWIKFEKDFKNFLYDFKISNQTRSKLRTQGKRIKESLSTKPEYKEAFQKICSKLPDSILKHFKPMYRQGYFYLYENEIIEIARQETRDQLLLLLYESLRHMCRDDPIKEAKKIFGL